MAIPEPTSFEFQPTCVPKEINRIGHHVGKLFCRDEVPRLLFLGGGVEMYENFFG
jgi:hypothetical protein